MSTYVLRHDEASCIACRACEVHCKTNKGLGPGPAPCKIITVGPLEVDGRPRHAHRLHALLPLRGAVVRQGLSDGRDAAAREGRHRLRRVQRLRGLQELHGGLPLGHAAVGPGHAQGGQVRLLHGSPRCRAAAGLRHQVRDRLPVLRRRQRGARSAPRALRPRRHRRAVGERQEGHERTPDAAGMARRRRCRPGGRRAAGADPRRRAARLHAGAVPDAIAAATACAGGGPRRMRRRRRADRSRLAAIPARSGAVDAGDRRDRSRRAGARHGRRPRPRSLAAGRGRADRGRPARQPQGRAAPAGRTERPRGGPPERGGRHLLPGSGRRAPPTGGGAARQSTELLGERDATDRSQLVHTPETWCRIALLFAGAIGPRMPRC